MIKMQHYFGASILLLLLLIPIPSVAQTCPPPTQPTLGNALERMILVGQADYAMQCIIDIHDNADNFSNEVWYQLAKNASDAIEALGGEVNVFVSYNDRATKLWDTYLQEVSAPFDQGRISFALRKLMQHGRFGQFEQFIPSIAKAFNRGRTRVETSHADQLFTTIRRCPAWNNVTQAVSDRGVTCERPCPNVAQSLLSALAVELGPRPWGGSAGITRLAVNAKAFEGSLHCPSP